MKIETIANNYNFYTLKFFYLHEMETEIIQLTH